MQFVEFDLLHRAGVSDRDAYGDGAELLCPSCGERVDVQRPHVLARRTPPELDDRAAFVAVFHDRAGCDPFAPTSGVRLVATESATASDYS